MRDYSDKHYWRSNRKNGTGFDLYVVFEFEKEGETIEKEESIDIPFDIFVEATRTFADYAGVNLDATDSRIWNFLVGLDALDKLADDDSFLAICKELYLKSKYFESDREEIKLELEELGDL
jgi:hypothetical protein